MIKVSDIVPLCLQHEMPAVGITDLNNLFGVMDMAKNFAAGGVHYILGNQITVRLKMPWGKDILAPLLLFAQNEQGYKNLMRLSTLSYQNPTLAVDGPFVTLSQIQEKSEGLLCLTGGEQGPLGALCLQKETERAEKELNLLREAFDQRLYIEIMRHNLPEQKEVEPQFLRWAFHYNIPIVATNDVFYPTKDQCEAHDALLCISNARYLVEEDREKASPHKYFKSQAEMNALFANLPEALENTVFIAQRCTFQLKERAPLLPPFQAFSGLSEEEELEKQAISGLEKRLTDHVLPRTAPENHAAQREHYFARLHKELAVIKSMGFPGYFLIVADFIKFAKNQNIPVGPGRGSGAGSLVAWSLTITDIDPIQFDLIFERFLNPERVSMPDFDVDFCQDRREEVIAYVLQKYGADKVAQIITFGKLQARGVLRDVGRVLSLPYPVVDKVCHLVPLNPANPVTLEQAVREEPAFQEFMESEIQGERLLDISLKLEGLYRHTSIHAAGVVIGGQTLAELVPLYYDGKSPLAITQIDMKYIEKAGLLKFDFLGLRTLTVIQNCCDLVKKSGQDIDISTLSLEDPATFDLLRHTNAMGVFQVESGGMRDVLKKMQPDRFDDLIALVALYRPGPMDDIPKYLARKNKTEDVTYLHPKLEPILQKTYGVMVYQEQVMQIAQELGGYTLGGADILRRAMGKKNKKEMDKQSKVFIEGAEKKGIATETAKEIFDLMAKFASYGFNKSHSAPYALISYRTAYLKAHYPLEFYAAAAASEKGNIDKLTAFFQDMKENKFELLPPDVNFSFADFMPEKGALRYALSAIKNVGEQSMQKLVAEREENGPFLSLENFVSRMDPGVINKRQLENLIMAGALDGLHANRKQLFYSTDALLAYANSYKQERGNTMRSLFGEAEAKAPQQLRLAQETGDKNKEYRDWNLLERAQKEFEAFGFFLSEHPLHVYGDTLEALQLQNSTVFETLETGALVRFAAVLLSKEERISKSGNKFAFLTMSDPYGVFEVPFFSENYAAIRNILEPGLIAYVEATVRRNNDGSLRLVGQTLEKLDTQKVQTGMIVPINEKVNLFLLKDILAEAKKSTTSHGNVAPENETDTVRSITLSLDILGEKVWILLPQKVPVTSLLKAQLWELGKSAR
ncbi:DNA-directed DNA polymerase [Alphaproteobacteria bacterium]|nr:DNA-directed DNA polymerase [Alphaproteobacteria bacterium]GHS96314.1 DNA-directed DNA polymerase [Alphaproteobacteria bacterium]